MNNLEKILKEQGRSKTWLGRKMGVTFHTINNWCKGKGLDRWKVKNVAEILGVEPKDISDENL